LSRPGFTSGIGILGGARKIVFSVLARVCWMMKGQVQRSRSRSRSILLVVTEVGIDLAARVDHGDGRIGTCPDEYVRVVSQEPFLAAEVQALDVQDRMEAG